MKYFRYTILIGAFLVIQAVSYFVLANAGNEKEKAPDTIPGKVGQGYQLNLDAPIDKWDEAIPLGNGMTGGLLWGTDNEIRLSLDRGDLWDLRPHPGFTAPGFDYATVRHLAHAGLTDSLNKKYARGNPYPTKLPGCRLVVTLPEGTKAQSFHLNMKKGLGEVQLLEGKHIESFFSAVKPVALMKVPGTVRDFKLTPNQAVKKLGYALPTLKDESNSYSLIQDAALGLRYAFHVRARKVDEYTVLAIAMTTNRDDEAPLKLAQKRTRQALNSGYDVLLEEHKKWWDDFWSMSTVNIPAPEIQQHYNLVQYFYGAASRRDAPPIPLQGLWTADEGNLPPWHGDYHHDLNTELTYWAYLTSNRFDQGLNFIDFMWSLKPVHEGFAQDFFGTSGHVVPGVMAMDGKPMGAWYQYTLSPTMGAWVAQSFYKHWRYTMDVRFLKNRAYPYCKGIAEALVGLMESDDDGKLKLPLSTSPELHNNTQQAWLTPNSNFDLALIRWIFSANADMAKALDKEKEAARWQDLLSIMNSLAVVGEEGPLKVAPDETLNESHRHFSHLMAIHPLGILNVEGSKKERNIIEASLKQMDKLGTSRWTGYSFSWMACMRARVGQGDRALEYLRDYMHCTLRNGFHVNGPQTRKELTDLHMRAFTLERNFAASDAVHEMLLQSWGDRIRVFPATPEKWKDVSFTNLRAEGGFVVDAEMKEGKTVQVTITATVDQPLRLENPFGKKQFETNRGLKRKGDELRCYMKKGQTLRLEL